MGIRAARLQYSRRVHRTSASNESIGNFGHESFGEPYGAMPFVIFEYGCEGVSARVRGVIVSPIVVHGPIQELKTTIGAVIVQVEEIRDSKFTESQF
jgi:hypothetical protein